MFSFYKLIFGNRARLMNRPISIPGGEIHFDDLTFDPRLILLPYLIACRIGITMEKKQSFRHFETNRTLMSYRLTNNTKHRHRIIFYALMVF